MNEYESILKTIKNKKYSVVFEIEKYDQKSNEIQLQLDVLRDWINMLLIRLNYHDDDHIGEISVNKVNIRYFFDVID